MNKKFHIVLWQMIAMLSGSLSAYGAETLSEYVAACKRELGFTSIPELKCSNAVKFGFAAPLFDATNDYVGYARINDSVDLTFACRWVGGGSNGDINSPVTQSVELMVHNRISGSTCFFSARNATTVITDPLRGTSFVNEEPVSSTIISPTSQVTSPAEKNPANYWRSPNEVNEKIQCVGCHVAGPYIASPRIAPFLAMYGLLNNGHDTFVNTAAGTRRYHAVGSDRPGAPATSTSAFKGWDAIVSGRDDRSGFIDRSTCADGCHSIGAGSTVAGVSVRGFSLLPPISGVIGLIEYLGTMPPDQSSDYRSVNMDTPTNDDGEYETLLGLKQRYPQFYCTNPQSMSAHVVGSDLEFDTYGSVYANKLQSFNLRDGLVCKNADQPAGAQCHDYETSYLCGSTWTTWKSKDTPAGTADNEARPTANPCSTLSPLPSPVPEPKAIRARYFVSDGLPGSIEMIINGPNDRLAQFDNKGLICKNADQGTGQTCSNYVTTFYCPSNTLVAAPTPLARSVPSGNLGTGEKTYVITDDIAGWQASNVSGRKIYINGVPVSAGQFPLPPKTTDGKYYITFAAGGLSYASWSYW